MTARKREKLIILGVNLLFFGGMAVLIEVLLFKPQVDRRLVGTWESGTRGFSRRHIFEQDGSYTIISDLGRSAARRWWVEGNQLVTYSVAEAPRDRASHCVQFYAAKLFGTKEPWCVQREDIVELPYGRLRLGISREMRRVDPRASRRDEVIIGPWTDILSALNAYP